jgi:hypothetical protein
MYLQAVMTPGYRDTGSLTGWAACGFVFIRQARPDWRGKLWVDKLCKQQF